MPNADTERLTREMFETVWNGKDRDAIDEFYAADADTHGFGEADGDLETYREWFDVITTGFPDIEFDLGTMLADGDTTAVVWHATGTHDGPLMGIEATGERGTVQGISINRFEGERIVESWMNFDSMTMLQLVGALPELAPAADD